MHVRNVLHLIIAVGALTVTPRFVFGQSAPTNDIPSGIGVAKARSYDSYIRLFGAIGTNIGLRNDAPITVSGIVSYQQYHQILSGSLFSSSGSRGNRPFKNWVDIDALYGYAMNGDDFGYFESDSKDIYVAASIGLGLFVYQERWRFGRRFFDPLDSTALHPNLTVAGIGVPIVVQGDYAFTKYAGFGATAFVNLNTYKINYGILVNLELLYP